MEKSVKSQSLQRLDPQLYKSDEIIKKSGTAKNLEMGIGDKEQRKNSIFLPNIGNDRSLSNNRDNRTKIGIIKKMQRRDSKIMMNIVENQFDHISRLHNLSKEIDSYIGQENIGKKIDKNLHDFKVHKYMSLFKDSEDRKNFIFKPKDYYLLQKYKINNLFGDLYINKLNAKVLEKEKKLTDKLNGVTRENLTGIRVVRAFNAEEYQEKKFEKVNSDLTKLYTFNQKTFATMQPIMYLVMNGVSLAIYFIGSYIIGDASMYDKIGLFGDMIVFSSYAIQVIMSFLMLAFIFMTLPRAQVSANRINEVLDKEISIKNGKLKENKKDEIGTVEFKNVSFKYPDAEEYLLENISFKANKGETVAFIGSTGSGKSTLINLVPRFYDATEGEVLVDGINVKDYDLEFLYNKIGYVPQKAVMFNGTVKSNIAYGDNGKGTKTEEIIKEAVKVAQATEFVEKMDDKYNTHIASGGTNVSGGQKQRLAIARAIARNPEIYLFDDSFSALDYKTDSVLRSELKKHTGDSTNLIVAQRIGTIMNADKIIVLDEGKIVGQGTHKELLKTCEIYKQIALSQLSEKELNM